MILKKPAIACGIGAAMLGILSVAQSQAQTNRCCLNDCSPKPHGLITDVYVDEVPAYACGGGDQLVQSSELNGAIVMELGDGKLFVPRLGVAVESYDVETDYKPEVAVTCEDDAGNLGSGNTRGTMGAGRCQ